MMDDMKQMVWAMLAAVVVGCLMPFPSSAAELPPKLSLDFDRVPMVQFMEATYKSILGEQYVIDPRLVDDARKVTIHVKDLDTANLRPFLAGLLKSSGIAADQREGVTYFVPIVPGSEQAPPPLPSPAAPVASGAVIPGALPSFIPGVSFPGQVPNGAGTASHFELYRPRVRSVDQLQVLANSLLMTQHKGTEAVILTGTESRVQMVRKLLDEYDVMPAEVVARAVIYEFANGDNESINVTGALSVLAGKLNINLGSGSTLANAITFKNTNLQAVVSAVAGDSRFRLVSAPSVRIVHGAQGRLQVGTKQPILDSVQLDKNGNPIQSVSYQQAGVIVDLRPLVMADRIEVALTAEVSSFTQTNTSTINSPTLLNRSVNTTVGVEDGELIVLGGLDEEKSNASTSGLFFLPPWLRFRSHDDSKTQIVIVLEVRRTVVKAL